jgi:hypothetical protein
MVNIFFEAHVEHFIGLIKNAVIYVCEVDLFPAHHIHKTTGSSHNDLWVLVQLSKLISKAGASVDGNNFGILYKLQV